MVKVRLARHGSKKRPYYHIVAAHSEDKRDGRFIEQLGTYDPRKPMADARIDHERVGYWVSVGARVTPVLTRVIREHRKALESAQGAVQAKGGNQAPGGGQAAGGDQPTGDAEATTA